MVDADGRGGGFKLDSAYRAPASAIIRHPEVLLPVAIVGVGIMFATPGYCGRAFPTPTACRSRSYILGLLLIVIGLLPYPIVKFRRAGGLGLLANDFSDR